MMAASIHGKPNAVVLGGVANHIPLIKKLQERGYRVILVDYLPNPPAKASADEHVQVSTFDEDAILELSRSRHVSLIVNCCLEYLNEIAARVSEKLGLPEFYSSETARNVSDKTCMKRIMVENGVPTSRYVAAECFDADTVGCLKFPLFVKPADGSGSNGVLRAENEAELDNAFNNALAFSRSKRVIIEEEAPGLECNVYCYILHGVARALLVSAKYSEIHSETHRNTKCIGTYAPASITEDARAEIDKVAQGIANGFRIDSSPMFMQVMVDDDRVSVIEFACRVPGGYGYRSVLSKLGFDYFDFSLDVLMGEVQEPSTSDTGEISIVHSFYAYPGIIDSIEGIDELISDGTIVDANLERRKGSRVSNESCNREKVGQFVIAADCPEEAFEKVHRFFDVVHVVDTEGNDILRHDLVLEAGITQ